MAMTGRARLDRQEGQHALVDTIPFAMPVASRKTAGLMAGFSIDLDQAAKMLPGDEVHPLRLWNKGLLIITVVNYLDTSIGKYIEFSIAIACTHTRRPAPRLLPLLFRSAFGVGQYVVDLPVSTEVSVKGGKGIWGMPKHQANLRFDTTQNTASSQYDLDGQFCMKIEIQQRKPWIPVSAGATNYCAFRGMLWKSGIFLKCKAGVSLASKGAAILTIGEHPRVLPLKLLQINPNPAFTMWFPEATGLLDDHFEAWFINSDAPPDPTKPPEGMESVINLGQSRQWLDQPFASVPGEPRGQL